MKKSGFLLFLIIFLALTAFMAGYIMVGRTDTPSSSKTGTILDKFGGEQQPATDNPETADETRVVKLTERKVMSAVNSYNKGSVMYFEKNTGKLFELNLETKTEQPVLDKSLINFVSAVWSPTKKAFLGSFASGPDKIFKYIDIATGQETSLDPNIRSAAFSPDGSLIVYHQTVPSDNQTADQTWKIMISEPDGKYPKKILNTRLENIELGWPIREKMSLQTPTSELFLLSEDGKLSGLLGPSFGLNKKWSPSGKKIAFSFSVGSQDEVSRVNPVLKLRNIESGEETPLGDATADKCVWSIDDIYIYCAVPKSPSVDEVYKINTLNSSRKMVAEPLTGIGEIFLSPLEEQILFTDSSDEKLYSIKISD